MAGVQEWFENFLSKTNGSDFNKDSIPDSFEVTVRDGDKIYAKWDITEELLEHGMVRKNFTNASLNIDAQIIFMHHDFKNKFENEESLKKILEAAQSSEETWFTNRTTSVVNIGGHNVMTLSQGALTLLIGLIGLVVKLKAPDQTRVVKVTRVCYSVWCIFIGHW